MAVKYKMLLIPVIINTTLFFLLSILHFYWAVGGRVWYDDVLPTNSSGLNKMNPGTAGFVIAFGLLFFALLTLGNLGLFDKHFKRKYFRFSALIITIIFFLRAMGDFKLFGFFKTISRTKFGVNDTQFFTPSCVFIAFLSLIIFVLQRRINIKSNSTGIKYQKKLVTLKVV